MSMRERQRVRSKWVRKKMIRNSCSLCLFHHVCVYVETKKGQTHKVLKFHSPSWTCDCNLRPPEYLGHRGAQHHAHNDVAVFRAVTKTLEQKQKQKTHLQSDHSWNCLGMGTATSKRMMMNIHVRRLSDHLDLRKVNNFTYHQTPKTSNIWRTKLLGYVCLMAWTELSVVRAGRTKRRRGKKGGQRVRPKQPHFFEPQIAIKITIGKGGWV